MMMMMMVVMMAMVTVVVMAMMMMMVMRRLRIGDSGRHGDAQRDRQRHQEFLNHLL